MNGVIIIDKPKDFTSFDVCAVVRRIFHEKRVGHAGTLDPQATGVLPVLLGNATRAADILPADDKVYLAEMTLGIETDTEDIFGTVLAEKPYEGTEDAFRETVLSFEGTYDQLPPMYSAKKVGGKKLYELAREGKTVERKPVPVTVHSIEIVSVSLPKAVIRVHCSKGTYIRTLIADIGKRAGSAACMSALRREKHGLFTVGQAVTVDELKEAEKTGDPAVFVLPTDFLFETYPRRTVREECLRFLQNGNKLFESDLEEDGGTGPEDGALYRLYTPDGVFSALYRYDGKEGCHKAFKMFLQG